MYGRSSGCIFFVLHNLNIGIISGLVSAVSATRVLLDSWSRLFLFGDLHSSGYNYRLTNAQYKMDGI